MSVIQIVKRLSEEIDGQNRKEIIELLEEQLSDNIEELSKNEIFFNLPLKNILSVISKVDFISIGNDGYVLEILQNIIKHIISAHFEEKETILILQNIRTEAISFHHSEIFSLLELITNCPILVNYCKSYKDQRRLVDIDYDYIIKQKDKEISKLQEEIAKLKQEMNENSLHQSEQEAVSTLHQNPEQCTDTFQPNIFVACKEGKLSSVQRLIEKEGVDKNIVVKEDNDQLNFYKGEASIHIATKYGHLQIVQYLIEKQNVDKESKGYYDQTPLHYACWKGNLPIVEFLISNGANIEAQNLLDWTALHFASYWGQTDVVKYLISRGENKNVKNKDGKTPYESTQKEEIRNFLK